MGNAITLIAKVTLTAYSIRVRVSIDTATLPESDLMCAAFERNVNYTLIDWVPQLSSYAVKISKNDVKSINVIDELLFDAMGTPIKPDTRYKVLCHIRRRGQLFGNYLFARFRTRPIPACVSGVSISTNSDNVFNMLPQHGPIMSPTDVLNFGRVNYTNFHDHIDGMIAFEFPHPTPRDMDIKLTCCEGTECVFWMSLFRCSECTGKKSDGLAQQLISKGWGSGFCSPHFDETFRTIAFHTKVDATEVTIVEVIPSRYHEILIMFGVEGDCPEDWCSIPHGAFPPEAGCVNHGCPNDCLP